MTIGLAVTCFYQGNASFLLAADTRHSHAAGSADMTMKTYALGGQVGAVAVGNVLSVASAADLTRGVADDHNQLQPETPINFYSTV